MSEVLLFSLFFFFASKIKKGHPNKNSHQTPVEPANPKVPHDGLGLLHQARPVLLLPDHQQLGRVADDGARRSRGARGEQRAGDASRGDSGGAEGLLVEAVGPELDRGDGGEGGGVDLQVGGERKKEREREGRKEVSEKEVSFSFLFLFRSS